MVSNRKFYDHAIAEMNLRYVVSLAAPPFLSKSKLLLQKWKCYRELILLYYHLAVGAILHLTDCHRHFIKAGQLRCANYITRMFVHQMKPGIY